MELNFEEFNEVAKKLSAKHGQPEPDFFQCLTIRENVKADGREHGHLHCHSTAHDADMNETNNPKPCRGLLRELENK